MTGSGEGGRGGKWNIKAYLEGDGGMEGLGWIRETLDGGNNNRGSQPTAVFLTDGVREEGRERVRQWTTGGDKVDKKSSPHPKPPQTSLSLILPVSLFITHPLFPPFLTFPALFPPYIFSSSSTSPPSFSLIYLFFDLPSHHPCLPFFCFLSLALLFFLLTLLSQVMQEVVQCVYMHRSSLVTVRSVWMQYVSNQILPFPWPYCEHWHILYGPCVLHIKVSIFVIESTTMHVHTAV